MIMLMDDGCGDDDNMAENYHDYDATTQTKQDIQFTSPNGARIVLPQVSDPHHHGHG